MTFYLLLSCKERNDFTMCANVLLTTYFEWRTYFAGEASPSQLEFGGSRSNRLYSGIIRLLLDSIRFITFYIEYQQNSIFYFDALENKNQ